MTPAQIDSQLEGDRFAPALLDDAEKAALADSQSRPRAPMPSRADCPDWCVAAFRAGHSGPNGSWRPPALARAPAARSARQHRWRPAEGTRCWRKLAPNCLPRPPRSPATASASRPSGPVAAHPNVQSEPAFRKGLVRDPGQPGLPAGGRNRRCPKSSQQVPRLLRRRLAARRWAPNGGGHGKSWPDIRLPMPRSKRLHRILRQVEAARYAKSCRPLPILAPYGNWKASSTSFSSNAPCTGPRHMAPAAPDAKWRVHRPAARTGAWPNRRNPSKRLRYVKAWPAGFALCHPAFGPCFPAENGEQVAAFLEKNSGIRGRRPRARDLGGTRSPARKRWRMRFEPTGGIVNDASPHGHGRLILSRFCAKAG